MGALLCRAGRRVRGSDPGFARARHAGRTLLAVLAAIGALRPAGQPADLFAAISAGFLLQCASGGGRRDQLLVLVGTGLAMAAGVAIGAAVGQVPAVAPALVVASAFLTFFVRRFGPSLVTPSLFTFILVLLSTAFAGGASRAALLVLAVLVGLVAAVGTHLLVPRADPRRVLADLVGALAGELAALLRAPATWIRGAPCDERHLTGGLRRVAAMVTRGQVVADELPRDAPGDVASVRRDLYEVLHAAVTIHRSASMLTDAAAPTRAALAAALEALAADFAAVDAHRVPSGAGLAIAAVEHAALASTSPSHLLHAAIVATIARRLDDIARRFAARRGGRA
ncbi:MAG: hypothetical protein QM820_42830 [Minicystis sp.]